MAKKKDEYIALSGYCKKHNLSVPNDFNIEDFVLTVKEKDQTGVKVSGWKFRVDVLDEYVPKLGFREVQKRPTEPEEVYIFATELDSQEVYIFASLKESTVKQFVREIEDAIDETVKQIKNVSYDDNPSKLIDSMNVLGRLVDGEAYADNIELDKKYRGKFYINIVKECQYAAMKALTR